MGHFFVLSEKDKQNVDVALSGKTSADARG